MRAYERNSSEHASKQAAACAYRNMRITGAALGISGGEDSVNKHKSANYLSTQCGALVVTLLHEISSTSESVVVTLHEGFHQTNTTDSTQTLCHHVRNSSNQGQLPRQEQPQRHRRVNVTT